jgi:hypothetical protein
LGAGAIGFVRRFTQLTNGFVRRDRKWLRSARGLLPWPLATTIGAIQIAKKLPGPEVPSSSSRNQGETSWDSQDDSQDSWSHAKPVLTIIFR